MLRLRASLVGASAVLAAGAMLVPAEGAAAAKPRARASMVPRARIAVGATDGVNVTKLGAVNLRQLGAQAHATPRHPETPAARAFRLRESEQEATTNAAPQASLQPPNVTGLPIAFNEARRGFEGLTNRDSTFVNGFEVEPPDQGLCGGHVGSTTFLFESVNLALALFDSNTDQLTPAIDLNTFFGQPPAVDFTNDRFGPFLSDPKCYYDPDTGHWFHSVLEIDVNPVTGDFANRSAELLAVSTTSDPFGDYNLYSIDTTDLNHPRCPCFGDQPLIGADANGFYVSTAEYSIQGNFFNGAQIYAFDKRALEAGTTPVPVHINAGTTHTGTVQPATSPSGKYETARNGTEYFMSGFDCLPPDCRINPAVGNQITVWAMTGTASLRTATPNVSLSQTTITSETYQQPVPQKQRPGPHPLGQSFGHPVPLVTANDTRMNQVVFADGRLWSGLNTKVTPGPRDGIAWFSVDPSLALPAVRATIAAQGYVAAQGANLSFPSIGVNDRGRGVIAYSLMGPTVFPSAGYTTISPTGTGGSVTTARVGFRPEDGFTCYAESLPPDVPPPFLCRWGDYTASFALPNGEVWSAAEMIPASARTEFANWGTFVWPVNF